LFLFLYLFLAHPAFITLLRQLVRLLQQKNKRGGLRCPHCLSPLPIPIPIPILALILIPNPARAQQAALCLLYFAGLLLKVRCVEDADREVCM
jgi:hypothetical protein